MHTLLPVDLRACRRLIMISGCKTNTRHEHEYALTGPGNSLAAGELIPYQLHITEGLQGSSVTYVRTRICHS